MLYLVELLKDVGEGLLNPSHVNICKMFGEQIFVGRSYIVVVVDLRGSDALVALVQKERC